MYEKLHGLTKDINLNWRAIAEKEKVGIYCSDGFHLF